MTTPENLSAVAVALPALSVVALTFAPRRATTRLAVLLALATGLIAVAAGAAALIDESRPELGRWVVVDAASGLFLILIGVVGFASVLASPAYLGSSERSIVPARRRERAYFAALFGFWAILLAIPVAGNLGEGWLLVEASTATSAFLVGFSGRPRALEAGWKYLVLTSLGLGIALLGLVLLAAGVPGHGLGSLSWHEISHYTSGPKSALVAYLLLLAGLAAKVGWAPVHNWLPDAHSEAPPPISALLSAGLLPVVLLVAWRSEQALVPIIGSGSAEGVLLGFGLVSLAVAVPFLWRPLAWKRLLAYSSLEHMGVLALGIGFATPLALTGVVIHLFGHAIAKALGFYAATPLLAVKPRASGHAVSGVARTSPLLGTAMGVALGTLAGVPPSPIFVSEVLIVAGGFQAGRPWAAATATVLLALSFLGLAHALLEITVGRGRRRADQASHPGKRVLAAFTVASVPALVALASAALWLPGSGLIDALAGGVS